MDSQQIVNLVMAIVGGGTIGTLITQILNRKKTLAEAKSINITGDISIGKTAMQYAETLRKDIASLKQEVSGLKQKLNTLTEENIHLKRENDELRIQNEKMKDRITILESKLK